MKGWFSPSFWKFADHCRRVTARSHFTEHKWLHSAFKALPVAPYSHNKICACLLQFLVQLIKQVLIKRKRSLCSRNSNEKCSNCSVPYVHLNSSNDIWRITSVLAASSSFLSTALFCTKKLWITKVCLDRWIWICVCESSTAAFIY